MGYRAAGHWELKQREGKGGRAKRMLTPNSIRCQTPSVAKLHPLPNSIRRQTPMPHAPCPIPPILIKRLFRLTLLSYSQRVRLQSWYRQYRQMQLVL